MKKIYQVPETEVMLMESTELMEASMGLFDEPIEDPNNILSREFFFNVED